jgi:hypothetical protein
MATASTGSKISTSASGTRWPKAERHWRKKPKQVTFEGTLPEVIGNRKEMKPFPLVSWAFAHWFKNRRHPWQPCPFNISHEKM